MMEALLRDDRLLVDLAQLASNLDLLLPGGLGDRVPFGGDEPLGLEGALDQIARLQAMDRLGRRAVGRRVAGRPGRDRPRRGPRPARRRRPARARGARRPGPPARGGRLPDPRRRAARADAARQPADRPEGPRRPVRPAPARRVRRPPDRPGRAGRGARGGDQAVRVRRPVPPRPARHAVQRARPRGERAGGAGRDGRPAGPARADRLRGPPDRAADPDVDRAARRHEPLDAAARLLPGRQEGRRRARHAHPDAVPARPPDGHRLRLLRPRDPARARWPS